MNDRPLTERERIVLRKALDRFAMTPHEPIKNDSIRSIDASERATARELSLRLT